MPHQPQDSPPSQKLLQLIPELRGKSLTVARLTGGLTNCNYRIDADAGQQSYVLRLPGKDTALLGIDRAIEADCSRAAAELGVGPEVVAYLPEHEALVRRFVSGTPLTALAMQQPSVLRRVVEAVRRYHQGPPGAGHFSSFEIVRRYCALARERQVRFPDNLEGALELLARLQRELESGEPVCPCHNDLLAGNLIDDGTTVRIIDWEYGGMGDRFFDLGNLAVNNDFDAEHERALLELYFGEARPEHLRRLRLMRLASDMREAMWGFLQSAISTLDVDYLAYGRKHLERFVQSVESLPQLRRD
jgi:thiamine kinase-like enzyme